MSHRITLASLLVSLIASGCAMIPAGQPSPGLESTHWRLVSVSGQSLEIPNEPPIELRFLDGRINFHGCNALSGRYIQEGNRISVPKGFVGTRMACNEELMVIDDAATQLLEQGATFRLDGNRLILDGRGQTWRFDRDGLTQP